MNYDVKIMSSEFFLWSMNNVSLPGDVKVFNDGGLPELHYWKR